ncbi:nicotinamide-nucleotide amidase [Leifsonia sp. AK011]|uniref:CinA family protein n=1 Tax=Leifsonia sp. AK011 TaxID=2723075 RepID=UPI00179287D5|nr:nicotinamide-nucleotide amidohydrolase family protein [Leifsonia sp. AK011]NYF10491.1 nicotinamide-nucleotide amidase [Leifsonia sp. AK011]
MPSAAVVGALVERGLTIAVAESLTGGMLVSELIATPGASATVLGGVVAYDTRLKHTLLGVDADLLAAAGAVDARVAEQMADRVRAVLAVDGRPADVGISTTGVAGPDPQDGKAVGTVFVGLAMGERVSSIELSLAGSRSAIRSATVAEALVQLHKMLEG